MIACGRCGSVNEEHDEFCQSCGGFLDATGRTAVTDDPVVVVPADAELALLRATGRRIEAEAEAARTLEAARVAESAAEEARGNERAARRIVEEAAGSPRPPREVVVAPDVGDEAPPDDQDRRAAALLVGWEAPTPAPGAPSPAEPTPAAHGSVPCAACGRLNEGHLRFCSKCGTRLGGGQVGP